jgi:uncharacterized membrane protein
MEREGTGVMSLIRVVPSVALAWLVYHCIALIYGAAFAAEPQTVLGKIAVSVPLLNGGIWRISIGDIIAMLTVITGFIEVLKASNFARLRLADNMLVAVLFTVSLIEFLTFRAAQTTVFFLMVLALFLDLTVGYFIGLRVALRDISVERLPV